MVTVWPLPFAMKEGFYSAHALWNEPTLFKRVKEQLHRIAFNLLKCSLCFQSLVDCFRIECTINKLNLNNALKIFLYLRCAGYL